LRQKRSPCLSLREERKEASAPLENGHSRPSFFQKREAPLIAPGGKREGGGEKKEGDQLYWARKKNCFVPLTSATSPLRRGHDFTFYLSREEVKRRGKKPYLTKGFLRFLSAGRKAGFGGEEREREKPTPF